MNVNTESSTILLEAWSRKCELSKKSFFIPLLNWKQPQSSILSFRTREMCYINQVCSFWATTKDIYYRIVSQGCNDSFISEKCFECYISLHFFPKIILWIVLMLHMLLLLWDLFYFVTKVMGNKANSLN